MSDRLHPTAVIHPGASLHASVSVGPYAVIEDGVEIGAETRVGAHAVIHRGTVTGPRCQIDCHAVIGGLPQDLSFDPGTPSGVLLGAGVVVREFATIHRATRAGASTTVEDAAYIMSTCHIGHDCLVRAHAVISSSAILGGFCEIGAYAILGGGAGLHHFVRIGESAMIGGGSRVAHDVPPFGILAERDELSGLNLVGLKRRGFSRESIKAIKLAFRGVYGEPGNLRQRAADYLAHLAEAGQAERCFLEFFAGGKRGFVRPARHLGSGNSPS